MWWIEPNDDSKITLPLISKVCVAALTILTLVLGVYPQPILDLMK
jgi:NADH:ubiquinone oxidoreductase subunit 4 (subunit M)